MNFNKRVNGSWTTDSHYIHKTDTDTITTLPTIIHPNDTTAIVGLKGNMSQIGISTPITPIQPSEMGEETGNLFLQKLTGVTIASSGEIVSDVNYDTYIAEVSDGETYTISNVTGTQVFGFFATKPILGAITYNSSRTIFSTSSQTLTVPTGKNIKYIGVRYNTGVSNVMLNTGSTPLPYEPYGYKIPFSSGGKNLWDGGDVAIALHERYKAIPISLERGTYTLSFEYKSNNTGPVTIIFYDGSAIIQDSNVTIINNKGTVSINSSQAITTIRLYSAAGYNTSYNYAAEYTNIMLNRGSTPLPYEPYNRITTPVYLGEVSTTRQIKKLVLDGTENWTYRSGDPTNVFFMYLPTAKTGEVAMSNAYPYYSGTDFVDMNDKEFAIIRSNLAIRNSDYQYESQFKAYLAQQYTTGKPVCVWYILTTPETGIVNEPIRKIGDYADEVSNITIPTITGTNILSVDTTLQPSEVSVNYKGWHPVQSTHEKSRNLFDKDLPNTTTIGYIREDGTIGENNNYAVSNYIELQANTQYTVSNMNVNGLYPGICFYDSSKTYISGIKYNGETSLTFTTPADCKYVLMSYLKTNNDIVMLNSGSTALPYESYWK